ncbi:hypothetical protein M2454_000236 [Aequitasia blattaphilus]|uniref:Transposase TnpC homeodomain domain-containing protein n=2 Tax=Lachnospiraceae TaxID=186803 RepID=A0ABT1EFZ2_9FIRM|nr:MULTISPECIES: hypothetical protein [Lachnospiraceae]MCP1101015.1 hypothetical protein [Aequitasia blattaphilus]MCP1109608.1 hypothetical protein [Ohessyouella blattaphilus]MCR8563002.1 hypothetical protein [Ohessyouella blattaphilus]MCR8613655.1 hypothetical protein [Aequitasia blattaphilus]
MGQKYTAEELNQFSKQELVFLVSSLQGQMETMNENLEKLIEQVRIANQQRFGRHTEKLDTMDGQLSFLTRQSISRRKMPKSRTLRKYYKKSHVRRNKRVREI